MPINKFREKAFQDLRDGIFKKRIWAYLAWQETKVKYRRSILGPFWITLSAAIFIAALGPIYGTLMGEGSTLSYIFYLAIGYIIWQFISGLILDGCQAYISSEALIKEKSLPISIYPMVVVWRNLILLVHNIVIIIFLSVWCVPVVTYSLISLPIALFVLSINGLSYAIYLGAASARFRDIPQIIASLLQLLFVLTPVFWYPNALKGKSWAFEFNPFYHFLEIIRAPLIQGKIPIESWKFVLLITVINILIAIVTFIKTRSKIAFWV